MLDRETHIDRGLRDHYTAQKTIASLQWAERVTAERERRLAARILELEQENTNLRLLLNLDTAA